MGSIENNYRLWSIYEVVANISYKGPGSKYFLLWRPYDLSPNAGWKQPEMMNNQDGCVAIKLYLQKQVAHQTSPLGHNFMSLL